MLIAKLMLEPADLLLLDEPTNDLDIATLEILEESLLEYTGALVLVTHDRYMLDRVSTIVLGLDGKGGAETFADYSQWEQWRGVTVEESIVPGAYGEGGCFYSSPAAPPAWREEEAFVSGGAGVCGDRGCGGGGGGEAAGGSGEDRAAGGGD